YTQTASGSLTIQLSGPPASGPFGRFNISGTAALDGTLILGVTNGYVPRAGDSFQVMTYTQKSGSFASFPGLVAGRSKVLEAVVGDTDVRVNSLIDAIDLAVINLTIPASGVPGQNASITYTVQNTAATPTLASTWVDSVYLSLSDAFNT